MIRMYWILIIFAHTYKILLIIFVAGNNPARICELCSGFLEKKCSTDDPFAGYDGAFKCMSSDAGDVAFLRHDTVSLMAMNSTYRPEVSVIVSSQALKISNGIANVNLQSFTEAYNDQA